MKEGEKMPKQLATVSIQYKAMEKCNNWYVFEVKVTGLSSTRHRSYWLLLFQSGKKWSHTWCLRLTFPLTKYTQEHPEWLQILFLSNTAWVRCQCCLGVTRPLQPHGSRHDIYPWVGIWGQTGGSVTGFSKADRGATMFLPAHCDNSD